MNNANNYNEDNFTVSKLFSLILLHATQVLFCVPVQLTFTLPFTVIGFANKTTFYIEDAQHQRFILKYHPRGPKRAIHDALGAFIGKSIGLYINEVELFCSRDPFNQLFTDINPLTASQIGVTTLHRRVPGIAVREIKKMNEEICIKRGLRKEKTLRNITQYFQLSEMVAFDIFSDNTDRHNGNLFFNKKTGLFYAIDMDHAFKSAFALINTSDDYHFPTVATKTYNFLEKLYKKRLLSTVEIKALQKILHVLEFLVALYPPEVLFQEWMLLAAKATISYNVREQVKIKKYLVYHIREVERLIQLLRTIKKP